MRKAALYVSGRLVTGSSHLDAFEQLSQAEQNSAFSSGVFDTETREFQSDLDQDHFFDKKILLLRHGAVIPDYDNPPLSEAGQAQVVSAAKRLQEMDLTGFVGYVSPLRRCQETAQIVQDWVGLEFETSDDLIEIDQESITQFKDRITQLLRKLPERSILVAHCGVVTTLAKMALCDERVLQYGVPTASLTYIDNQKCTRMLHEVNHSVGQTLGAVR